MSYIIKLGVADRGPQRVFIAIPVIEKFTPSYALNLMQTDRELAEEGISLGGEIIAGHCHVDDARNILVRDFLESDCTDFFFIDADVGWKPKDFAKLLSYDRDVIAGIYPYKSDRGDFPCTTLPGEIWSDKDGLIEVEGVPTGFLRIKRHVLQKLYDAAPKYLLNFNEADRMRIGIIFERTLESEVRYSGDYVFCRKWRKMGGKVFIDPNLNLSHFGEKEWSGCYGNYLKAEAGFILETLKSVKRGKEDPDTILSLCQEWDNDGFCGSPEFILAAIQISKESNGPVIELGSGLSTLAMAAANPKVQVHCLEDDYYWASRLTDAAKAHSLDNVFVHLSPIVEYPKGKWYAKPVNLPENPSFVVIDGPKRTKGNRNVVFDMMSLELSEAIILVDDTNDYLISSGLKNWAEKEKREVHQMGKTRKFSIVKANKVEVSV